MGSAHSGRRQDFRCSWCAGASTFRHSVALLIRAAQAVSSEQGLVSAQASATLLRTHRLNVTEYAHQAITSAYLLSRADCPRRCAPRRAASPRAAIAATITARGRGAGSFSSNMGRLAYELMVARRGLDGAQAISLDMPWFAQP